MLNVVVKTVVHRARPVLTDPVAHAHGLSLPTAQGAATFAVVAVLVIGISRIALGVHYVSHAAGGYFLGAAWVVATAIAFDVTVLNRTALQR